MTRKKPGGSKSCTHVCVIYSFAISYRLNNKDACRKTQEEDTTQDKDAGRTSLTIFLPLTLLQASKKGCWRVACERMLETEHKLHILTPLLWPSRCVFLVLLMLGSTPLGFSEGPLGRVWPSLPHLVSSCLEFCWQLLRGVPRSPSVGCGLPYHISSLTLWESAGNCFGGFPSAPSVGCGLPYHIWSLLSRILLATALGPKLNWVK